MHILNIVTSPRKEQSASRALVDTFLREYMTRAENIAVDVLDVWQECLPETALLTRLRHRQSTSSVLV
jgi:FMN-dependent NADH-azoreductase